MTEPVILGTPDDSELVQMNNRVPATMKDAINARAKTLGISRDEWVRRAFEWALLQPPGTPVHPEQPR